MDCSPQGFSVHGILQARMLQWVIISFSRAFTYPGIQPVSCIAGRFFTIWATNFPRGTVVKKPHANVEGVGSVLSGKILHATTEMHALKACALQQENPPQWKACAQKAESSPPLAMTRESPHTAIKTKWSQK